MISRTILIDARELNANRISGIGRVLTGLIVALSESRIADRVELAAPSKTGFPEEVRDRKNIRIVEIRSPFVEFERTLSRMTRRDGNLYISPYPKLPLFGCHCRSIHTIHDVLDLTHFSYRKRIRRYFDLFRLRKALKSANITWYDSETSCVETQKLTGLSGADPRVRYPGIGGAFPGTPMGNREAVLNRYGLEKGYILILGNGLPHKNPGVLLKVSNQLKRDLVMVGVSIDRQRYWQRRFPQAGARWFEGIDEADLPTIVASAFALAQPSYAEGYGYPPLEAMACGTPAIVSRIPVLVETTGGNALTAHPDAPEDWLAAIKSLEDESLYRDYVKQGIEWVARFQGTEAWNPYISDIEELLNAG